MVLLVRRGWGAACSRPRRSGSLGAGAFQRLVRIQGNPSAAMHSLGEPARIEQRSGVFDARALAAGMRQSSLEVRIHGVARVECAGTQLPRSVPLPSGGSARLLQQRLRGLVVRVFLEDVAECGLCGVFGAHRLIDLAQA